MKWTHPFHFANVPLVLAHNGDLAEFARMKPLLLALVIFVATIRAGSGQTAMIPEKAPSPAAK
jgi:predicted glutamine amidotransferase